MKRRQSLLNIRKGRFLNGTQAGDKPFEHGATDFCSVMAKIV